ncbi:hypothetical protein [Streptomyces sp. NPDC102409]|uniref:hypothetical protein n=1 Tax=Streptomyces sp. NPDC102409 TaxID=3366172 RepID=UPI003807EB6C
MAHSGHHDHGPHSAGLLDAAEENLGPDPYVRITVAGLDRPWTDPLEHPRVVPHHGHEEFQHWWRAWALAGLGRVDEAITVAGLDRPWTDPRLVKADLLRRAGRLDAAADELRALGTIRAREELCEVLVLRGRADEAIAVHPTVAEQRVAEPKPEPVPLGDNGYSLEPSF